MLISTLLLSIFLNSIVIHYSGDENLKRFLFLGENQITDVKRCESIDCINVDVNKDNITLSSKFGEDSYIQNDKFNRENLSMIQKADILRIKIILFDTNLKKKYQEISKKTVDLSKQNSNLPPKLSDNVKKIGITPDVWIQLKQEIKSELLFSILPEIAVDNSLTPQVSIEDIQSEIESKLIDKIDRYIDNITISQKNSEKELTKFKDEIQIKIKNEIEKEISNKINSIVKQNSRNNNKNYQLSFGISEFFDYKFTNNYFGLLTNIKILDKNRALLLTLNYFEDRWSDSNLEIISKSILLNTSFGLDFNIYKNISFELSTGIFISLINNNVETNTSITDIASGISLSYEFNYNLIDSIKIFFKNDIMLYIMGYDSKNTKILYNGETYTITLHENSIISLLFSIGFSTTF
ncbi:hypothetical protein JXR93_05310 [bacterium]|nr:hypothetical protein [bacterium]